MEVEVFFDCSCVWAWLAFEQVGKLSDAAGVAVRWRPVLTRDVFETVNPAVEWPMSEVKQEYYRRDLELWADCLGLSLRDDPSRQPETSLCMLACVAAGRWGGLETFARLAFEAAWAQGRDLGDRGVLEGLWNQAGLPVSVFEAGLNWPDIAAELRANTRELMERGGFGVPTFFLGDDMFFGNDAVPLLERAVGERLKQAGHLA